VRISLIRFLGAGGLSPPKTKQARPRLAHNHAIPQTLCVVCLFTLHRSRVTRFAASVCLPWFPPSDRHARHHLPSDGSFGPRFPAFPVGKKNSDHRYYVPPGLPSDRLRVVRSSLSFPDTLPGPSFVVCVSAFADSSRRRGLLRDAGISPSGRISSSYLSFSAGRQTALPSSRATPVNACPGLRPRWCPVCWP